MWRDSNDAKNSALPWQEYNYMLKYIQIESS